jgi:carbon monoxide dehydrogenase subunit G
MKVALEKSFPMSGPAEVAWQVLRDVGSVAACMPGARITESLGEGRYKGTMNVRIGPAAMSFRGELEVRDIDPATKSLALVAKGTDSTGTSGAAMDLKARIESTGDATSNLLGASEVSMSGKAAALGGRMMNSVADQLMQQFSANFAARVAALAVHGAAQQASAGASDDDGNAPGRATGAVASGLPPAVPSSPAELNGLALAWSAFKDWLRNLSGRKAA